MRILMLAQFYPPIIGGEERLKDLGQRAVGLGAEELIECYQETNQRRWSSEAHRARDGRIVLTLTHPGRANWCNPDSDPSRLVQRSLAQFER